MKSTMKCWSCGQKIGIIDRGLYSKVFVDLEAVRVTPDPCGEDFIRIDGSKIRGREIPFESDEPYEPAYRQHRKTCGVKKG